MHQAKNRNTSLIILINYFIIFSHVNVWWSERFFTTISLTFVALTKFITCLQTSANDYPSKCFLQNSGCKNLSHSSQNMKTFFSYYYKKIKAFLYCSYYRCIFLNKLIKLFTITTPKNHSKVFPLCWHTHFID